MSHGITSTDEVFTTRMPAWHGLGTVFENYPSREEAQHLVHPWEPVSEPVYINQPFVDEGGIQDSFVPVPNMQAICRSDNSSSVLGVLSDNYEPVMNSELWDIAEAIEQSGSDVQYETAGSLEGGRKVWVLIKLKDPVRISGDPNGASMPYYALQNSNDGTSSFRGQAITTRIVCANTAQIADTMAQSQGTEFRFNHSKNIRGRISDAQQALAGWRESVDEWRLLSEHLVGEKITLDQRDEFLERFIPEPLGNVISDRVRDNIAAARGQVRDILLSPTCEGVENTPGGLVAAATEYAEHVRRAHSAETRFKRSFLNRNLVVSKAMDIARDVARV